MSLLAGSS